RATGRRVDEAAHEVARRVQLGDRAQPVLIEQSLHQRSINLLADASILAIEQVLDLAPIGERRADQAAQSVVAEAGGLTSFSLAEPLAIRPVDKRGRTRLD